MDELFFPVAAVTAVFFIVIPALTLLSRTVLHRQRDRVGAWTEFGSNATFAWLIAPTALPVFWLVSSALHEVGSRTTAEPCLVDHVAANTCIDTVLLIALLAGGISISIAVRLWRERPSLHLNQLEQSHPLVGHVRSLANTSHHLSNTDIRVVRHSAAPIYTFGLFRRRVVLDACFVHDADNDMLLATLLHEQAHIDGWDTFRNFVARLCLAANPLGAILVSDFRRWSSAREAVCDSEAVQRGGRPLALAAGILKAARFQCGQDLPCHAAQLRGSDTTALKLRLALLMHEPSTPVRSAGHVVLVALVVFVAAFPHVDGMNILGLFHYEVERVLHTVLPAGY